MRMPINKSQNGHYAYFWLLYLRNCEINVYNPGQKKLDHIGKRLNEAEN